jgi:MFS family permease
MVIQCNFAALKRVRPYEYMTRFILGGSITVIAALIAQRWGPSLGGLFLAFPAIFPASATLLEKHERDKKRHAGIAFTHRGRLAAALDARGAVMGAIGGLLFAVLCWRLLPHISAWAVLPMGFAAWLVLSALLWYIRRHHPWSRPKR